MDCSACYITLFCCKKSHLFTNFQLRQTYLLCFSFLFLSFISAMARAAIFPSVSNLNFRELHTATSTVEDTIAWLRQHGLLATDRPCNVCGNGCNQIWDSKRKDGCRWRCQNRDCKRDVSIRDESFFGYDSKLELKQVLDLLYLYAYQGASTASLTSAEWLQKPSLTGGTMSGTFSRSLSSDIHCG